MMRDGRSVRVHTIPELALTSPDCTPWVKAGREAAREMEGLARPDAATSAVAPVVARLSAFWTKIFAVSFGMGVVSGIAMPFQFGTNWSRFADATADVISPLMAYEGLMAFFLESAFLGVLLFGRKPGAARHPFLRRADGGAGDAVFVVLDHRGEQLDADAGRVMS